MPLTPGTRLGAYEIIAALGAGGMGEVFRARDTRLDRVVAIKVLTGALAADSESRVRFEHEARAIAALNHPHICTIHDVGRHGDVDYLVMEYLEGETLADRLRRPEGLRLPAQDSVAARSGLGLPAQDSLPARGSGRPSGLPIDEALAIAIQIGDALDRAHRAGIVHRDLKPGNVMLVRGAQSGVAAKLLDFGLAARTDSAVPRGPAQDVSTLATMAPSIVATRPPSATPSGGFSGSAGFSGTLQYMAPEQMDGQPADHRADVFAFGCVLYEMLAGRKAFEGATTMTVIAAIMSSDPKPIPALQAAPPVLDHLLRRCLDKDPERRWQSMGDVTGELRWIAEQPMSAPAPAVTSSRAMSGPLGFAVIAATAVVGLLALLAGLRVLRPEPTQAPPQPMVRFEVATAPTDEPSLALSPDGTQMAFVANQNRRPMVWVRALDKVENRALPGSEGASLPFWSPDGRTIAFFADNKLKRIDVAGGTPLVITDAPIARGAAWSKDGVILFAPGVNAPIRRVSTTGGPVESVTTLNTGSGPSHRQPQFLPDGKRFLFYSALGTAETNGIYLGSLDKTPPVRVLQTEGAGRFIAPGTLLTVRQGALVAYRFNEATGALEGEPSVVAQGFGASGTGIAAFSTSDTGVLAYRTGSAQRRQLMWVNRQGQAPLSVGEPAADFIGSPELSPDERAVAVFRQPTGDNDIWVIDFARSLPRRVTDGPPADAHPLWDPDGQHVVFGSQRLASGVPLRQTVNGSGKPEPLFSQPESGVPLSWTADRRFVLLRRNAPQGNADLVAVSMDGQPSVPVAPSAFDETEGQFSPDGTWVAFVSNETGRPEVFVQTFPEGGGRTQVSTAGGAQVRWSADGKEIFYVAPDGQMTAVSITVGRGASPELRPPVALFQSHLATGGNVIGNKPQYAVSRDGRFLLNTALESDSAPIIVSVNWMKDLAR